MEFSPERIRSIRHTLQMQTVETVFNEFGRNILNLSEEKRAVKYRKMSENVFRFFRGSTFLFYFYASREPLPFHTPADTPTWIQGDMHFENFGAFQNESGDLVYDVNDFDEGYLGSYLYDLLRMSVSIVLVAEMCGFSPDEQKKACETFLKKYYKQIRKFAENRENPVHMHFTEDNTKGLVRKCIRKAKQRGAHHLLQGITEISETGRRFVRSAEIQECTPEERNRLEEAWPRYLSTLDTADRMPDHFYRIKDVAVKHGSGTASIGLDRYYILVEGSGEGHAEDIVLEVKEVRAPVPAYFLPYEKEFWEQFPHQGQRVIATQKAMHHAADPHLGYLTIGDKQYYVRERSPFKKRIKTEKIKDFDSLCAILKTQGKIAAKIHARADTDVQQGLLRHHSEAAILEAMGDDPERFADQISWWALSHARQVHDDYQVFCEWTAERFGNVGSPEPSAKITG